MLREYAQTLSSNGRVNVRWVPEHRGRERNEAENALVKIRASLSLIQAERVLMPVNYAVRKVDGVRKGKGPPSAQIRKSYIVTMELKDD